MHVVRLINDDRLISDELFTVPGMQKDGPIHKRKPSSMSHDSDDSCRVDALQDDRGADGNRSSNAGDSGLAPTGDSARPSAPQPNLSNNAGDRVAVPRNEMCPAVKNFDPENFDLDYKIQPPTGRSFYFFPQRSFHLILLLFFALNSS